MIPLHVMAASHQHMVGWCAQNGLNHRVCVYLFRPEQAYGYQGLPVFVYETTFSHHHQSLTHWKTNMEIYHILGFDAGVILQEDEAVRYQFEYMAWKSAVDARAQKSL